MNIDLAKVREDLENLHADGYRSLAIVLAHSYTYPEHELQIAALARAAGFAHVSASSQLLPMIKMVPRGVSSTADAYLTPILREYLDGFFSGFDAKLKDGKVRSPRVEFMSSDGGLLDLNNFSGLKSILSGPAGGVVGYALTSWDEEGRIPIIGCAYSRVCTSRVELIARGQDRCGRDVDGRFALRRTLRGGVRDDDGRRDDSVSSAGHQHCCCWGRLLPHVPEWSLPCRTS